MASYYDSPYFNTGLSDEIMQPQQLADQQFAPAHPYANPQVITPQTDNLKAGGFKFTIKDDKASTVPLPISDGVAPQEEKRKRGRPRKDKSTEVIGSDMNQKDANGNVPTMYTYAETTNMLRGTLAQLDQLESQIKTELDNVSSSRTLKSKYNVMVGLSGNLSDIIGQKISVIKEINNAISKSNEMDYKREKDMKSAEDNINDDKYLMDMYNAFIQNPGGNTNTTPLGPTSQMVSIGSDMSNMVSSPAADNGYLSYVTNMTPEQRLMSMEDNPNVKQCVIYDAATGNKTFQWMDLSTGQPIPGLPTRDQMFLEDTTIDLRNNIAKNINLNETYPVITINDNIVSEY